MTRHTPHFSQRHFSLAVVATAAALALSACSSSDQSPAPANTPAPVATTTAQAAPVPAPAAAASATPAAKFAAYTAAIPGTASNKQCALDTINAASAANAVPLAAGSNAVFGGWAGNGKGQAANGFLLVLKGAAQSYSAPIATEVARADVARALSSDGMANSGYNLAASLTGVAAGSYQLFIVDPADANSVCDLQRSITVQ